MLFEPISLWNAHLSEPYSVLSLSTNCGIFVTSRVISGRRVWK